MLLGTQDTTTGKRRKMKNFKTELPCTSCGIEGLNEFHHVQHRSQMGPNEPHNLMALCRKCHTRIHSLGKVNMANRFPSVKQWFLDNNWFLDESSMRWKHEGVKND